MRRPGRGWRPWGPVVRDGARRRPKAFLHLSELSQLISKPEAHLEGRLQGGWKGETACGCKASVGAG